MGYGVSLLSYSNLIRLLLEGANAKKAVPFLAAYSYLVIENPSK